LANLGLDNAIRLRWALRDIKANRLKLSPIDPKDLRILIDMGYVEMKNDQPILTSTGLDEMEIGRLSPFLSRSTPVGDVDHVKVFANEEAVSTQPVGLASGRFRVHIGGMEKTIISLALIAAVIVPAALYSRWTLRGRK
jgi:hypothetical protein